MRGKKTKERCAGAIFRAVQNFARSTGRRIREAGLSEKKRGEDATERSKGVKAQRAAGELVTAGRGLGSRERGRFAGRAGRQGVRLRVGYKPGLSPAGRPDYVRLVMRNLVLRSMSLGVLTVALACSSDDDSSVASPTGGESDEAGTPPAPDESPSAEPPATSAPSAEPGGEAPESPPNANAADTTSAEGAAELQPALPVVANPNHDELLASDVPELAANKRLVYDAWRTLIEARDTVAAEQYFAEDYIQHNPNVDTGRQGVLELFASFGAPLEVQERVQAPLVSITAEGDLVALAQVDARDDPRPYTTTWFDLFRIENGLIAEHWDHGRLPAGGTPAAYVPPQQNPEQEESLASDEPALAANKRLVHDMWRTLLDAQQVEEAPRFLAEGYVQHNPLANTGLQGFLAFFRQFAQPREVQPTVANFIHVIAEDDLVVLATARSYDDANGTPYATTWFDMFRVSDGLLVEHWDTATIDP